MMDAEKLLTQLLAAEDKERRKRVLEKHKPLETIFFQLLKDRVRQVVREDNQKALRMTEVGLEAVEFAEERGGVACAWWARGNALLFVGQYDNSLAAYTTAISIYTGLDQAQEIAQLETNCMLPLMWTGRYAQAQEMGRSALEKLG
ncbi:MAG: hypothetical protein GY832_30210 [Chloroflexi bacterium]|nr:hypothetical protein [Chloroflexota bacterium]